MLIYFKHPVVMIKKTFVFAFFCLFTLTLFSQKHYNTDSFFLEMETRVQKTIGHPFLNFQAKALDGKLYTEKDLIGKVTFINFWFELCSPCIAELDDLNRLYLKFKDNQRFQYLSFTRDSPEELKVSTQKYQLLYPVISITESECHRLNGNLGFPTTIIVDETGKIVHIKYGGSLEKDDITKDIQKLAAIVESHLSK